MKQLFAIYTIIGIILAPFIYQNNAEGYRPAGSSAYQWGKALGGALYWPSYLFSIEPKVDSKSLESFQNSIIDMVNYRNDKLFTGKRSDSHASMIFTAIGNCLAREGADKSHILSLYNEIFAGDTKGKEIERIRTSVMKKMDGYDFADIVKTGAECGDGLDKSLASATISALADTPKSGLAGGDVRSDNPAPVSEQKPTNHVVQDGTGNFDFSKTCNQTLFEKYTKLGGMNETVAKSEAFQYCATANAKYKTCMSKGGDLDECSRQAICGESEDC